MEKGQCATVASWEGGAVRSRKSTQTPTTPGQVNAIFELIVNKPM